MTDSKLDTTAPAPSIDTYLEQRRLTGKDGREREFNFLVINNSDRWLEAELVKGQYHMPIIGQQQTLCFDLHGVSLAQWEDIESKYLIPEWDMQGRQPDNEFISKREAALMAKRIAVIEVSSGKLVPGETMEEKVKFMQSNMNPGEIQALYLYIQNNICSVENGDLLTEYRQVAADSLKSRVTQFSSFDSWKKATEIGYVFQMQRPSDDFILEFQLKNITAEAKQVIDVETREPEAPMLPKRDKASRSWNPREMEPDLSDPSYLARKRAVNQKRVVMFFNACLPFEIPGKNNLEQYEWISKRLIGDVIRLRQFIEQDLCGYGSRYDFFSAV
jgi:hypothetical protein